MAWPDIQLPSGIAETTADPVIRSEFEDGIVQTRPRYTRIRHSWELSWNNMRGASYRTLRNFYASTRGGSDSFTWTHPTEGTNHTVRFKGDLTGNVTSLYKTSARGIDYCYSVKLTLEEV